VAAHEAGSKLRASIASSLTLARSPSPPRCAVLPSPAHGEASGGVHGRHLLEVRLKMSEDWGKHRMIILQ